MVNVSEKRKLFLQYISVNVITIFRQVPKKDKDFYKQLHITTTKKIIKNDACLRDAMELFKLS